MTLLAHTLLQAAYAAFGILAWFAFRDTTPIAPALLVCAGVPIGFMLAAINDRS